MQEKGDIEWSQEATATKKKKADKMIFFFLLNIQLIITLWNLLSQDSRAKSMGRMQRKDQTLAEIVMRAFTATFGKVKTEIKV